MNWILLVLLSVLAVALTIGGVLRAALGYLPSGLVMIVAATMLAVPIGLLACCS
jgi:hypothetical protein